MDTIVWRFLMEKGIKTLPVDPKRLAEDLGYEVYSYQEGRAILEALGLSQVAACNKGLFVRHDDKLCIFYADGLPRGERNHVLFHELGHCLEKHDGCFSGPEAERTRAAQEEEAEMYALESVPTPVLYKAGLTTARDIRRGTQLDAPAVEKIVVRVAEYGSRKFEPPERKICDFYKAFIKANQCLRGRQGRRRRVKRISIALVLAVALCASLAGLYRLVSPGHDEPALLPAGTVSSDASFAEGSTLSQTQEPPADTEASSQPVAGAVYWTASGDVYHLSRNCPHIKHIKDEMVQSGSVEESGKTRACMGCSP